MPLTTGTPRWQKIATFTLLAAILLTVVFIYARAGTTNEAVTATRDSVERTDCARAVNAEQTAARDAATIADRAANRADGLATSYYFQAVLTATVTREQVTQAQVDEFSHLLDTAEALRVQADEADKVLASLPDPAEEVDRRCPG